jgi:V8-like Glu-specific endopeptidase
MGSSSIDTTPIKFSNWSKSIREVKAKPSRQKLELSFASFFGTADLVRNMKSYRRKGVLNVTINADQVGRHFFPPSVRTVQVDERKSRRIKRVSDGLSGYHPPHLRLAPLPMKLPKELQIKPAWRRKKGKRDNFGEPGTIFPPDTRFVFSDTSFPYCTCGLIQTAAGSGSGVMIGPRHMMTASHAINWGADGSAGWVKFIPLNFDTSEPFGSAFVSQIYWWQRVNGSDGVSSNEAAFDYVVCTLDRRLGDVTGWMGASSYSPGWNGGAYWAHIGYPSDLGGGLRPVFHGDGIMDSTVSESFSGRSSFRIMHRNDYWFGQSGGPAYGWWTGDPWPRVVATYSAVNWGGVGGPNANGGGDPLPELINFARSSEP